MRSGCLIVEKVPNVRFRNNNQNLAKLKILSHTYAWRPYLLAYLVSLASRSFPIEWRTNRFRGLWSVGKNNMLWLVFKISLEHASYHVHFKEIDEHKLAGWWKMTSSLFMQMLIIPFLYCYRVVQGSEGNLWCWRPLAAGVPFGPLFGQIKNGQDVVLEDGTKIIAKDFTSL